MTSRDQILAAVRRNKPPALPHPPAPDFAVPEGAVTAHFRTMAESIGIRLIETTPAEAAERLAAGYPAAKHVASAAPDVVPGTMPLTPDLDPHDLAHLDLFVCRGTLGVAENGAVWVPERNLVHRAAPFLTQHLTLLLDREALVWNLHEAYARIAVDEDGFGLFIAGPSKTADIEQSLVIGAHGPRSLTLLLV